MKHFFSSLLCLAASIGAFAQEAPATQSLEVAVRFAPSTPAATSSTPEAIASELTTITDSVATQPTDSATAQPAVAVLPAAEAAALPAPAPAAVELTGFIYDEKKRPLRGATIMVKGTTTAASTDANGHYSLLVPPGINTLLYDYVGRQGVEISASNFLPVNVTLTPAKARSKK